MRRTVSWITQAVAGMLLAGATSAQAQQLPLSVADDRRVEMSSGPWGLSVAVSLPGPPPVSDITVNWTLVSGSATAPSDFTMNSGLLTFTALIDSVKFIPITINGDTLNEWSPTLMQDEVFFIELSNPSANATISKGRGTITLLDDDRAMPGVQFASAVTGASPLTSTQARLQWRVPAALTLVTDVVIRWNVGAGCSFPTSTTGGVAGTNAGGASGAGMTQFLTVSGLTPNQLHCFSVFAIYGGGPTVEVAQVKAKPFDGTIGSIAWSYATGSPNVVPPTVGTDAIYTADTGGVVHAMGRGPGGGFWPSGWNPVGLGKPTQNRSAVVPMRTAPTYGDFRLFLGTDGGGVHALDAKTGSLIWSRSSFFNNALPSLGGVQAQPAGLFKGFGGNNDMLLVGTNNGAGNNSFFALDPATGNDLATYPPDGLMGDVKGMAVVDYPANRVYFLSASAVATFFALDLGPMAAPSLTLSTLPGGNRRPFGSGSSGSAVLRNNRLVFGDSTGQVYAIDLGVGTSFPNATGDGQVKGFLWPDRRDDRLYFATNGKVHAWRDMGGSFLPIWTVSVTTPSMVLQKPGTDFLYVGDGNGALVQINVLTQAQLALPLETGFQIGAPSLDGPNNLVIVGSSSGTIHAVRVPY